MKKQLKKLTLNKKTISNLTTEEMGKHVGGSTSCNYSTNRGIACRTLNGGNSCYGHNTCNGQNTCYTC